MGFDAGQQSISSEKKGNIKNIAYLTVFACL